jgi:DNA processing protein
LDDYLSGALRRSAHDTLDRCHQLGIHVLPLTRAEFPLSLKVIPSPPLALFLRGKEGAVRFPSKMLGVVGTRSASVEVCQRASLVSRDLVSAGWSVVSGLALGVDGSAHRGALSVPAECPTIAVVAHGLDRVYPTSHRSLSETILERGGMVLSEYPPGVEPMKHHFLERNRIIAALSRGVLVVQAGERSGSLVTARFAADFGRDVFIMRSECDDRTWSGGGALVEDGAISVGGASEILAEYGERVPSAQSEVAQGEVLSIPEYLARHGGTPESLLRQELEGAVVILPGNRVMVT